jgi:dTDP-4-dehydrorhamnose reductase
MRCLVTGASGLLGINYSLQLCNEFTVIGQVNQHTLKQAPFEVVQADLSERGSVEKLISSTHPDIIVHCAALANLEACETDPKLAWRLNAEVPVDFARETEKKGIYFIHISTDAVFDGQKGNYSEEDDPHPLSIYARSKLDGEQAVLRENPQAVIARVVFYGWSLRGTRSLGEFFFNNLSMGRQVKGFTDVIFCPLEVSQLTDLLRVFIHKRLSGVYHTVSSEYWSKYDFGMAIARKFNFDQNLLQPASWVDGDLKATRSPNLTLNTQKLSKVIGMDLPGLSDGIDHFYKAYQQGFPQRLRKLVG